ncbi:MAG: CmcI family methyltransferase [Actinomycetota bacterium]
MYPFWDPVVWPLLQAVGARRIVEIGALRGETTALMLERLGPDTELHVIDPVPEFDPAEHEAAFPGRYIFHRDLSHNVLPGLPPVDVALVDGDHNWYTVYNELRMLAERATAAGAHLPVLVLHDVGWPYGRRDLYYAPERIPAEFRQPYARKGLRPGEPGLLDAGGINPLHDNAITEGGPRNGVMTALEDFLAEHPEPVRLVVLPVYYGLAIAVEERRLAEQPEVARFLDRLETAEGKDILVGIGESTRLSAILFQHNDYYPSREFRVRSTERYLDLLAATLLDEIYLDHEQRIRYLAECAEQGHRPSPDNLADPAHVMLSWDRLVTARRAGTQPGTDRTGQMLPYTAMGRARLDHLRACLDRARREQVPGDFVEVGSGRAGGAIFMRGFLEAHEIPGRRVWVADRFVVNDRPDDPLAVWADLNAARDGFARFDLLDDRVRFLQGTAAETLPDAPIERVAVLRLGVGDPDDLEPALDALYHKVAFGGTVIVDEHTDPTRAAAIERFRARRGIDDPVEEIDGIAACWRKTRPARGSAPAVAAAPGRAAPLPVPTDAPPCDLSVVVVFYNMRREAARTLHSLSRAYQRELGDVDYEVIVVENGSAPDQRLGDDFVRAFGPEFRYLDLGADATPSPVPALNAGLARSRGRAVAFMIDGAHVLTPGVLRHGLAGLGTYAPAVVVTQQWYVGPGQQPDAMLAGYDQAAEDELFRRIEWPRDGYRLFDIGHFIGDRDWLDGLWESNCIFVPRELLERYGGFDERFSVAGGGYANLEFYERMGAATDAKIVTILGEGSFHQVHGGTTTNVADPSERRATIVAYAEQFRELHGRSFRGPGRTIHFVGTMFPAAARTRARRMTAEVFVQGRVNHGPEGIPEQPQPIPDELRDGFTAAYWHSLAWRDTTWLGERVPRAPTDLFAYQEIIARVRPDWIVETGSGNGGRARFLASICDLLGHGQVCSIDPRADAGRPDHERITYLEGKSQDPDLVRRVHDLVGPDGRAVLILGSQPMTHMRARGEFEAYRDLVPIGSYVVVEHTIYNGHPVWPGHGPGPNEGVKRILALDEDFAVDSTLERAGMTFNPGGYLKRLR